MNFRKIMLSGLALLMIWGGSGLFARERKTRETEVRTTTVRTERHVTRRHRTWRRTTRHRRGLPPGLARRDRMTPGHENRLRRRGSLPPGIEKKTRE